MPPIQPPPRCVIFDFDGTLADTFALVVSAWNAAVSAHAGRTFAAEEVIARFGVPDSAMIRREIAGPAGDEAVEVYHRHYQQQHAMAAAFAGVAEMLEAIRRRRLPMGLVTGKGRRSAQLSLAALGWGEIFQSVVTGDDVEQQKPDPEGLFRVTEQLGFEPRDCVFVGDSPADIGAGRNARMRTIVAGWHPVYLDEVRAMKPDYWARTPEDVVELVGGDNPITKSA